MSLKPTAYKHDVNSGELPIGVFDSGLGGLTVLKSLHERFPHENFIYLGDTARIPYGTKSMRTIAKYLEQNLQFLTNQKVKAVVVACNSASSVISAVQSSIPLFDVIGPGAAMAAKLTKTGRIGVIATKATVANKSYVTHFEKLNPSFQIFQQASPLLVPLVEEGWDDDPITNLIIYRYLSPLLSMNIDTLVMGCTHYPILKNAIRKVVGHQVELVASGEAVAGEMERHFQDGRLPPNHSGQTSSIRFLTTDVSDNFQIQAQKIMAPFKVSQFELVDIN